ncbi:hypothetical protein BKA67DRAFT_537121 [Truncatella angustata]|uniref:Uncharacterized protein n=1 Tax=Truncatella angustata TaxID=152316 RepID=A0A9P8UJN9_9PEZI|nr:uncharacterized protein BKA67DRAFT_537121 [Truncatella angustata]KAH6653442.1 hypothetical protein BKA67DRAFT_537121 [Truncatella angustata]
MAQLIFKPNDRRAFRYMRRRMIPTMHDDKEEDHAQYDNAVDVRTVSAGTSKAMSDPQEVEDNIQWIRQNHPEKKILLWGWSAGAWACLNIREPVDLLVASYAVSSMQDDITHNLTKINALGSQATSDEVSSMSAENHPDPPAKYLYMIHGANDNQKCKRGESGTSQKHGSGEPGKPEEWLGKELSREELFISDTEELLRFESGGSELGLVHYVNY